MDTNNYYQTNALNLLARGFSKQFADEFFASEAYVEALHAFLPQFIDKHIPIVEDDAKAELAFIIADTVSVRSDV